MEPQIPAEEIGTVVDDLLSALRKQPRYRGLSFRGRSADARATRVGDTVSSRGLVATSPKLRVATENFEITDFFAVLGHNGRALERIARYKGEQEVVFLPFTLFLIVEQFEVSGSTVTVAEELDPNAGTEELASASLGEIRRHVEAAYRKAQESTPVWIGSPGKFVGDLD
jgi:hypothetical protein